MIFIILTEGSGEKDRRGGCVDAPGLKKQKVQADDAFQ